MNIVVERSSDDDYSSLSSCSSLDENLDEFLNIIYNRRSSGLSISTHTRFLQQ